MIVIRKTAAPRQSPGARGTTASSPRGQELFCLLLSTLAVLVGIGLVYRAKATRGVSFEEADRMLAAGQILNLNQLPSPSALPPFLTSIDSPADRQFAADKLYAYVRGEGAVPNVGALSRARAEAREIDSNPRLTMYREELAAQRRREAERAARTGSPAREQRVQILPQVGEVKSGFVVRTPAEFLRPLLLWLALYVLAFYVVHLYWWRTGFGGDQLILPVVHLLSGLGLVLMISLRDPLRDTLSFVNSAQGAIAGCALLLAATSVDFGRRFSASRYVPLALAVVLSVALFVFGSGPGSSDAKVNLLGFQPVEVIKILVVLFLAGYFAAEWEALRELREKPRPFARAAALLNVPRLEYVLPVVVGMALVMGFFFLQKDLGPALVLSCVFLGLYGVARRRVVMVAFGLLIMLAGFYLSYRFALSNTVADRIQIWLAPWENGVRGGDQLAHGFWALAAGGLTGTGPGLGDPGLVPAVHTDFIMAALGEELGFAGLLLLFACYALLVCKGVAISLRAPSHYTFFLAFGLTLLTALQILLISLGVTGLIPLSGVVSPLLSFGRSSMIANFAIFGILLSVSAQAGAAERREFRGPVLLAGAVLGLLAAVVVAKAAQLQVLGADKTLVAATLTPQSDGVRRYGYNPRLLQAARTLPFGSVYDRHGIPLATSRWEEIVAHRRDYEKLLGGKLEDLMRPGQRRYYPFGAAVFHLLGDARTRLNWAATNTAYIERDSLTRLQGFNDNAKRVELKDPSTGKSTFTIKRDYSELIPLLRHRYRPGHESVQRLLTRDRDVHTSIDIRLQMRLAAVLRDRLRDERQDKGAIVVLDPDKGDLLASVSFPLPEGAAAGGGRGADGADDEAADEALLDRARFGLYPPGSTFKIVTAVAALNKSAELATETFDCVPLGDGRVGNHVRGWGAPIRDDEKDRTPHGAVEMKKGIAVSCNAYFSQLGVYRVGPEALLRTAETFGISVAKPNTPEKLRGALAQAAYGQGQVVASPLQMARVAAAIASGGKMPYGRWVTDDSNQRTQAPQAVLKGEDAAFIGEAMRAVVTQGTAARQLKAVTPAIAGKTGTAEVDNRDSHSWFIGFAPFGQGAAGQRVAFSIIIEHGGYGGTAAAPAAAALVAAARELEIIR